MAVVGEPLQRQFDLGERASVEQLPQFGLAEEFGEQARVEREGLRSPFGQRGIPLVEEHSHVAEEQRPGERRRRGGVHLHQPHLPGPQRPHQFDQARHVEDVLEALPHGFQQDRERAVAARDLEQVGRPLALLPQR